MQSLKWAFVGLIACLVVAGCRPAPPADEADIAAEVSFDPSPPQVGTVNVSITLTDAQGNPVRMERLEVEGNMNHAGMRPVFTSLEEAAPGEFAGTIEFTMGGDWFLLLSGERADGKPLRKKVDVSGVQRQ